MGEEVHIRLARRRDVRTIALMSRDQIEAGLRWKWTPGAVLGLLRQSYVVGIVAEMHGHDGIAGFAILKCGQGQTANLDLLAVHPDVRRRGVGMALMAWLEEWVRTAGLTHITLQVRRRSRGARRFYRALGYEESRVLPRYYQGREDAVSMVRDVRRRSQLQLTVDELMRQALTAR